MGHKDKTEMKIVHGGNQMSLIRDTEEVLKFLEFAGRKSILNEQAINFRLTACNNLFSVLEEEEDNLDFILTNLDVLVNRFRNKNTSVQASTLKVYKSRVKSSLEDFKAWSADPFAWERQITDKARAAGLESRREKKAAKPPATAAPTAKKKAAAKIESELPAENEAPVVVGPARRVSFPIRPDFCVEMTIPAEGLTLKELQRLGLFLYPYCSDMEPGETRWPALPPTVSH